MRGRANQFQFCRIGETIDSKSGDPSSVTLETLYRFHLASFDGRRPSAVVCAGCSGLRQGTSFAGERRVPAVSSTTLESVTLSRGPTRLRQVHERL